MLHGLLTNVTALEQCFAVLNSLLAIGVLLLLTNVTALENCFAVLNGLLAIEVLLVSVDAAVASVVLFSIRVDA